jgi:hypothetical protein
LVALWGVSERLAAGKLGWYFSTWPREYRIFLKLVSMVALVGDLVVGIDVKNGLAASTAGPMPHEICWRPTPPAREEAGRKLAAHFATDVLIIEDEADRARCGSVG